MVAFRVAAAVEVLTGLALLVTPDGVARLLLGVGLDAGGAAVGRLGGVGLICFGLACWPVLGTSSPAARRAMLLFQPAIALMLAVVAVSADLRGVMLWPAVLYHAGATVWLTRHH
ncbi:hypothetical protein ACQW02_17200 [Humitalea sp. 24SJ18S-53]|uniref:hypothetical protein n=1 Tax=Humitalea sp. 24SJ18S-53 TaxID=3422307 RepID=UPI003D66F3BE